MELKMQLEAVIRFLSYFGSGVALTAIFLAVYVKLTPHKEVALIREGNSAAAYSLSGALLGFIIPLSSAIINSVNLADMLVWGAVALIVQAIAFLAVRLACKGLVSSIEKGVVSEGILLGTVSLAAGILNAACMSY